MNFSIGDIKEIVSTISVYDNMDYSGYGISFLKRRFAKIFETFNIRKITQFYDLLNDADVRDRVTGEICVQSTEMFRDPSFWRFVRDNVLKHLPDLGNTVWLPDETGGEEAFSFSIIMHEQKYSDTVNILCSNPARCNCDTIRKGILNINHFEINHSNYKRLEDCDAFESYFTKDGNLQLILPELRRNVYCKQLSYTNAIENEKIGLIASRNQALCFSHEFAENYFETLYNKLVPGGFLAIGIKEKLPDSIADKMNTVSEAEKIYRK